MPDRLERISCTLQNQRVCSFSIDDEDINLGQGPLFHQAVNSADQNWSGGSPFALIHTFGASSFETAAWTMSSCVASSVSLLWGRRYFASAVFRAAAVFGIASTQTALGVPAPCASTGGTFFSDSGETKPAIGGSIGTHLGRS
mmetsp:Transcript_36484/g.65996  ORF Transcript_36484/g.65996 Transcript_36484/m.65996 type:complete len:143 (-) Transcript_36484:418-846(-)